MKSTAYHLTSKGLVIVTEDQLISIWKSGDDPCWLDAADRHLHTLDEAASAYA